jgi:hypothetical protein
LKRFILLLLLLVLVGGGVYLYLPRGDALSAAVAATLSILNTDITSQRGGAGDFSPALDGDLLANGDVVKSSTAGRAVLTFFDASTITVETGSQVKVTTLNRLDNGGIQATIEQSLGRSWNSVQKLKTPDSKFEIKTPTSTAVVRGTSFEVLVVQNADGTFQVTYKTDEGELAVTANAGGTVAVPANTQVSIATNQPAPAAATPIPASPTLRVTSSAGLGYALTAPTGATCGSAGNKAEIPGCLVNGNVVTIREPVAGRYALTMTSAAAAQGATVKVEALRGASVEATQTLTRTFAVGDLVRSGFTYGAATPQTVSVFEAAELVTSVCGAQATGRVFSGGTLDERYAQFEAFVRANKSAPVSLVVNDADVAAAVTKLIAEQGSSLPITIKDVKITLDGAGVHLSGSATTPIGEQSASADIAMGPVNGKLAFRVRSLTAGPLPGGILDQAKAQIEKTANDQAASLPLVVRQVLFRAGCVAIIGTTPQ